MWSDPIADMLTRLRNANQAMKRTVSMPSSKQKEAIAKLLAAEGYIDSFGIATECGFGRRAPETVAELFEIHRALAAELDG